MRKRKLSSGNSTETMVMSRSKPFDLVQMLKGIWEAHPLNQGRVYSGTSRDMMEAKGWLLVNPWESGDMMDFEDRMDRFMRSDFEGWKEQDYPLWAFLRHYNRYAAPRVEVKQKRQQPKSHELLIYCNNCQTNHRADQECPVKVA